MIKYAFLMNMPGETPETCYGEYNNQESHTRIVGLGKEDAGAYIRVLAEEGFQMVDLCGDFNGEDVERLTAVADGKIKIRAAVFLPEEAKKMDELESLFEYGIIVHMKGVSETEWITIINRQGNTTIAFVSSLESGMEAAKELVKKGVSFMELCSWFDREKCEKVIEAIKGGVPVGTCGDLA